MRLLQRTALYQSLFALPLVVLGTAIGYGIVRHSVNREVDEQLDDHAKLLQEQLSHGGAVVAFPAPGVRVRVAPGPLVAVQFADTVVYDALEAEDIPWRIGRFPATLADGSAATITIGRSQLETDELVASIALSIAAVLILFSLCTLMLYRWLSGRLWRPFHANLQAMEQFRPDGPAPALAASNVDEFAGMARALGGMMDNMRRDYTAQKHFTEQAAHELRTPLAILQGKLDQLIQSPNMAEREAGLIQGMFVAADRMVRTIKDMLRLAKVGELHPPEVVDWPKLFHEELELLKDPIAILHLSVKTNWTENCLVKLSPLQAQVLVSNLLRNAVQHNMHGGSVHITTTRDAVTVRNTGPISGVDPSGLFQRFAKGDPSGPSAGLGLSMVQEIAEHNGYKATYVIRDGQHVLSFGRG